MSFGLSGAAIAGLAVGGATLASGYMSSKAAGRASDSQTQAALAGIDAQQGQFDALQQLLAPYVAAGSGSSSPTQQVIGFYQKYMGRDPNADTLAQWMDQINTGKKSISDAERIISSGQGAQAYALSGQATPTIGALDAQRNLIGLNGNAAQQTSIDALKASPMFTSMLQQGENSLLQNASATGGLRGGNTQAALAQFSPALLAKTINDQYSRLGGLTSLGQNAAAGVGNAGMDTGSGISNLLGQIGSAQAGGALGQAAGYQTAINGITSGLGAYKALGGKF